MPSAYSAGRVNCFRCKFVCEGRRNVRCSPWKRRREWLWQTVH